MKSIMGLLIVLLIGYGAANAAVGIFGEGGTAATIGGLVATVAILYLMFNTK